MLKKRLITALVGIPLLIAAVWFDRPLPWFTILLAILGVLAALEFYRLAAKSQPNLYFGMLWTGLFIISPHFQYELTLPLLLTTTIVLPLFWQLLRRDKAGAFSSWVWTVAGIFYIGWLLSHFVSLRDLSDGRNWVLLALFATFASDTAAFFVGRALGRHKLAPDISPGKTWEGTVAGLLGAVGISLLFTLSTPLGLPLSWGQAIVLGLLISIFGQLGDLVESLIKRNMGAKDSGGLFPGHGGALDRLDSVVFAGVVVYYYVIWAI